MKTKFFTGAIAALFFLSGCYTQLETIERPQSWNSAGQSLTTSSADAYSSFYTQEEAQAYAMGYNDGIFDADLQFRSYNWNRSQASLGFHWGRPFVGFGFGYGHFYDPFWHHAMLYDPFFYSFYGAYAFPPHMRYRHFAHFHNPWWFGSRYIIVYNNWNVVPGNRDIVRGPRSSGIHRGSVNAVRNNRTEARGLAGDTRSRVRGGEFGPDALPASMRTRGNDGGAQPASVDRRTRGSGTPAPSVNRRPAPPPAQATPTRTRGNNNTPASTGRTRGSNSSGQSSDVGRSRGGNSSSGTQAAPQRSSSGNNNSGTRNRNRNDNSEDTLSMSNASVLFNGITLSIA